MKLRMYLRGLGLGMIVTAIVLSFGVKSENRTMTDAEVRARAKELGMVEDSETLKDTASKEAVNGEEVAAEETDRANKEEAAGTAEVKAEEPAEEKSEEAVAEDKADGTDKSEEPTEVKKPENTKDNADKPEAVTEEPVKENNPEKKFEDDKAAAEKDNKKEETKEAASDEKKSEDDKLDVEKTSADNKKSEDTKAKKAYSLKIERGYSSDRVARLLEDAGVIDNAASFDRYLCSNGYDKRISVGTYQIPTGADYLTVAKLITHSN